MMVKKKVTPALVVAVGCLAAAQLSACGSGSNEDAAKTEPADVTPVKGKDVSEVKLSPAAARRVGIRTATVDEVRIPVRHGGDRVRETIPYSAVLYSADGKTFAYRRERRLVYVRTPITVTDIRGDRAVLASGPPVGTAVVTVGAPELYGTEFGVEE